MSGASRGQSVSAATNAVEILLQRCAGRRGPSITACFPFLILHANVVQAMIHSYAYSSEAGTTHLKQPLTRTGMGMPQYLLKTRSNKYGVCLGLYMLAKDAGTRDKGHSKPSLAAYGGGGMLRTKATPRTWLDKLEYGNIAYFCPGIEPLTGTFLKFVPG
ncbi:hypothetical protein AG1IA_08680 [Rhizoctonia solani AG-1 IA]|uniref:Uncharacterized protein n=1 Tax=Thanatephorus cucumeris (strain AG1-IA) TaxID=983506 RepID=L8WHB0_THACA|nr:hypothetical protein AG1IA_08680 [Rhizoctonia solani AG-1 IA]